VQVIQDKRQRRSHQTGLGNEITVSTSRRALHMLNEGPAPEVALGEPQQPSHADHLGVAAVALVAVS
jgi:hypothetical protein